MNIVDTFIKLTKRTYPYGFEDELIDFLPDNIEKDIDGNYFVEVGSGSKTIFACHLDTACKNQSKVKHIFDGKIIKTDGKTILGADDKAGVTVLLYMISRNVPGLYYFFIGEEVGCIGSTAASFRKDFFSNYERIISFDRRGTTSIITHQSSKRGCSDEFADALSKEFAKSKLNLEKDDGGVYTDSAEFMTIIPECTNISVGYYKEHTHDEHQDIEFLQRLCRAAVKVDWERLVTKRNPNKVEWKNYGHSEYNYYGGSANYSPKRNTSWRSRNNSHWNDNDDYIWDAPTRSFNKSFKKTEKLFSDEDYYGTTKGREFYGNLETEITTDFIIGNDKNTYDNWGFPIIGSNTNDHYKGVREMYLDDTLTPDELDIIKDQCLNLNDEMDRDFFYSMRESIS
jgi:hypothetical protein